MIFLAPEAHDPANQLKEALALAKARKMTIKALGREIGALKRMMDHDRLLYITTFDHMKNLEKELGRLKNRKPLPRDTSRFKELSPE